MISRHIEENHGIFNFFKFLIEIGRLTAVEPIRREKLFSARCHRCHETRISPSGILDRHTSLARALKECNSSRKQSFEFSYKMKLENPNLHIFSNMVGTN